LKGLRLVRIGFGGLDTKTAGFPHLGTRSKDRDADPRLDGSSPLPRGDHSAYHRKTLTNGARRIAKRAARRPAVQTGDLRGCGLESLRSAPSSGSIAKEVEPSIISRNRSPNARAEAPKEVLSGVHFRGRRLKDPDRARPVRRRFFHQSLHARVPIWKAGSAASRSRSSRGRRST